ncbi:hypothetical protein IWW34DRAFT_855148 [Fusarium oxysporum f. sp. albedinis]|nr:hypothetical protein IWW34DRAFT_855148 [Fusarium oxysporum f. sp. albedinis]KAK2471192.1 hypothetical protein H9L39_17423 [Fusarium oxysporum f. sp. albedinis]
MRFVPVPAALLTLMDFLSAWTQDRNGVWTANNNWYTIGSYRAHEAYTVMNTERTHVGPCTCFSDDRGNIFRGRTI